MKLKLILVTLALICLLVPLLFIITILPVLFFPVPDSVDKSFESESNLEKATSATESNQINRDIQKIIETDSRENLATFTDDEPRKKSNKNNKKSSEKKLEKTLATNDVETVAIEIPNNALSDNTPITINSHSLYELGENFDEIIGFQYEFGPEGKTFDEPVRIYFYYDPLLVEDPSALDVYYYNKELGVWESMSATLDEANNRFYIEVNHFSTFALVKIKRDNVATSDIFNQTLDVDVRLYEYDACTGYSRVAIVNNGTQEYYNVSAAVDNGSYEFIVGALFPNTGIVTDRWTLDTGYHTFYVKAYVGNYTGPLGNYTEELYFPTRIASAGGYVKNSADLPIENALIRVKNVSGKMGWLSYNTRTNQDGSFTITTKLSPSTCRTQYSMTINATGFEIYQSNIFEINTTVFLDNIYLTFLYSIECQENNSIWTDCSNIAYNSKIIAVRVNCTDADNVSLELSNIPDNYTFFNSQASLIDRHWVYDNDDILIQDSGRFHLTAYCGNLGNNTYNWTIPFGMLQPYLIYPLTDLNVTQNKFFNFSSGVRCVGGECGDVNASLDPSYFYELEYIPNEYNGSCNTLIGSSCDDCYVSYNLPWSFNFFENNYSYVYVSTNGVLDFDTTGSQCCCYNSAYHHGKNAITPLWGDTYAFGIYACNYNNPDRVVIRFNGRCYSGCSSVNWETVLYKNGDIKINYGDMNAQTGSCNTNGWAVGISGTNVSDYLDGNWSNNGNSLFFRLKKDDLTKGTIPMNNGTPFYTISQNPAVCYNMQDGDTCNTTWEVNATGDIGNSYDFFTIYESNYEQVYNETDKIEITIKEENRAPVLSPIGNKTVNEGTLLQFTISATDPDLDILTYSADNLPTGANFNATTQTFTWTSTYNQAGSYSVVFNVTDGQLQDSETITVTVNDVNRAPTANDDSAITDEDISIPIDVLANDIDVDGDNLTIINVTQPTNGIATITTQQITYTPDAYYNGIDSFTYTITDGLLTDTATVSITINPVNYAPVLDPIADITVNENETVVITATATDPDLDTLAYSINDSRFIQASNIFTWQTDFDDEGVYDFLVSVSDGTLTDSQTVTVTVNDVNRAPTITSTPITTAFEDVSYTYDVNANDPDGDNITYALVTSPAGMTINPSDGVIEWTPTQDDVGDHGVNVSVTDGNLYAYQFYTLTVQAVNDAPIANDDSAITDEDISIPIDVLANDIDVDGDNLTIINVTQPTNGIATITTQQITYTPDAYYNGIDSFTYTITDGLLTDTATVTITVNPINDAPVLDPIADITVNENETVVITATATDVDGDTLTYSINDSRFIQSDNVFTWQTTLNDSGYYTIKITVSDGKLNDSQDIVITIINVPIDNDGDGYIDIDDGGDDCNDTNPTINPGAIEVCNDVDDDCNLGTLDGYGEPAPANTLQNGVCLGSTQSCTGGSWVDDYSSIASYEATETNCDTLDNDCDGGVDEGLTTKFYQDADSDNYGNVVVSQDVCTQPEGYVTDNTDCNDADAYIFPGNIETCDSKDNDCDSSTDEDFINLGESCTLGLGECEASGNYVCTVDGLTTECDATAGSPSAELCNGLDNDCDGIIDDGGDALCDDYVFCNGQETCQGTLGCQAGTTIDCSAYDLLEIAICNNNPDNNPFTYDYFTGFISTCDEDNDRCTTGTVSLTHTCNITQCSAECEINIDCDDGYIHTIDVCQSSCVCEHQPENNDPTIDSFTPTNTTPKINEGESLTFSITASDLDGDALTYSWKLDVQEVSTTTSYTYSPGYEDSGLHVITVNVSDSFGGTALQQWNVNVNEAGEVFEQSLDIGWNNVTLTVHPFDTAVASVLSSIEGKYNNVWAEVNGEWLSYSPTVLPLTNTLTHLDETTPFYIEMNQAATLVVIGTQP